MNELNWCEIGLEKSPRNEILSEYLKNKGIPNQFSFIKSEISELKEKIKEAQNAKQHIRFHPAFLEHVSKNIGNSTRELDAIKSIDSLMYDAKLGYWPENLLKESILECLTLKIKNLDVSQQTFVIGSDGVARSAITALIKLGFSKINVTGEDDDETLSLIKEYKNLFFNVDFGFVKRNDVTILPGSHGLVVNAVSVLESKNFTTEIYYFNFLKKGGLVIDLVDVPPETPFIKIAKDIGAQAVFGYEVFGYFDLRWVEKVTGQKLELLPYLEHLKSQLENATYDKIKVQKILTDFQI